MASRTAARSPSPTGAGGQDDGSYTNSLKLYTPSPPSNMSLVPYPRQMWACTPAQAWAELPSHGVAARSPHGPPPYPRIPPPPKKYGKIWKNIGNIENKRHPTPPIPQDPHPPLYPKIAGITPPPHTPGLGGGGDPGVWGGGEGVDLSLKSLCGIECPTSSSTSKSMDFL